MKSSRVESPYNPLVRATPWSSFRHHVRVWNPINVSRCPLLPSMPHSAGPETYHLRELETLEPASRSLMEAGASWVCQCTHWCRVRFLTSHSATNTRSPLRRCPGLLSLCVPGIHIGYPRSLSVGMYILRHHLFIATIDWPLNSCAWMIETGRESLSQCH